MLVDRLRSALARLNAHLSADTLGDAFRKLTRADSPSFVRGNRAFPRMLVDGVEVECRRLDGSVVGDRAKVVDLDTPENNDWLAANQFTVVDGKHSRCPDIAVFLNGLPLALIQPKNAADENGGCRSTLWRRLSGWPRGSQSPWTGCSRTPPRGARACSRNSTVENRGVGPMSGGTGRRRRC